MGNVARHARIDKGVDRLSGANAIADVSGGNRHRRIAGEDNRAMGLALARIVEDAMFPCSAAALGGVAIRRRGRRRYMTAQHRKITELEDENDVVQLNQ